MFKKALSAPVSESVQSVGTTSLETDFGDAVCKLSQVVNK